LKNNKLNILFLASWYPNSKSTLAGNFIQQHAIAVSKHVNVAVIHTVAIKDHEKNHITKEWNNNVFEVIVYYNKANSAIPILSNYQKTKNRKVAHIKGYEIALQEIGSFNLVHLNVIYPAGLFALYLNKKYNLPYILTEHWTAFQKQKKEPFSFIEKYFIKKISRQAKIICPVSNHLKETMQQFGIKNKFQVIPNAVNTGIFNYNPIKKVNKKCRILHISNLKNEHKNITGILNTIKKLSEKRSDFIITIAGDGNIEKYKKMAISLGIPDEIIQFEGRKTLEEIAETINKNDLFLLFSNYETFSVVIAEAQVCGLPIISSKCGGLTNEIALEDGVQVPINDERELCNQLNYLIDTLGKYDNIKIAKKAAKKYSYESVGQQFFELYNTILK